MTKISLPFLMISRGQIMIFCAKGYNLTVGCHNFFRRREIFSSFKILNEKIEL